MQKIEKINIIIKALLPEIKTAYEPSPRDKANNKVRYGLRFLKPKKKIENKYGIKNTKEEMRYDKTRAVR